MNLDKQPHLQKKRLSKAPKPFKTINQTYSSLDPVFFQIKQIKTMQEVKKQLKQLIKEEKDKIVYKQLNQGGKEQIINKIIQKIFANLASDVLTSYLIDQLLIKYLQYMQGDQNKSQINSPRMLSSLKKKKSNSQGKKNQALLNILQIIYPQEQYQRQSYSFQNYTKISRIREQNKKDRFQKQKKIIQLCKHQNYVEYIQKKRQNKQIQNRNSQYIGKNYRDSHFPPNQRSIGNKPNQNYDKFQKCQWQNIGQQSKYRLFTVKPKPYHLRQGNLGNCYLIAALAALAEKPQRIFNLFLQQQHYCQAKSTEFYVKIIYKGIWMLMKIDKNLLMREGQPAFSKPNEHNSIWPVIIQKAWAKLYGNYKAIQGGFPEQALHDLTGAPIRLIKIQDYQQETDKLWELLELFSQKRYAMVTSSYPGSNFYQSVTGIILGHAYTLMNVFQFTFKRNLIQQQVRLVKLRNPWGHGESNQQWNDFDSCWDLLKQQRSDLVKCMGFEKNAFDGIFFMKFQDFIKQFKSITVAQIMDNASYVNETLVDNNKQGVYFKIEIRVQGFYWFYVDNTPERVFDKYTKTKQKEKQKIKFKYPRIILQMAKIQPTRIRRLQQATCVTRTLYKRYQLSQGQYCAYVRIQFDELQQDRQINLAGYSEYACIITEAPRKMVISYTNNPKTNWYPQHHRAMDKHKQTPMKTNNELTEKVLQNVYQYGLSGKWSQQQYKWANLNKQYKTQLQKKILQTRVKKD